MHTHSHALVGWLVAEAIPGLERRDRVLIFLAGVVPDLDGLTILGKVAGHPELYENWHHVLCHNITAAAAYALIAGVFAKRRVAVALLALVGFHLHLLSDYLGSASPDGSPWSIPYLRPFSAHDYYNDYQW
ncbi:metal-dependent hydrolase [Planctomycetota bacterium]|nr:metal-dependent hydrolase [Planctomycetota bacterium]